MAVQKIVIRAIEQNWIRMWTLVVPESTQFRSHTQRRLLLSPPFLGAYMPLIEVKIASVVTAYNDPITGDTLFLVIHEALYFGDRLPQMLLNQNQIRYHGNKKVHNVTKQFDLDLQHAIKIPSKNLLLPLGLDVIILYLPTCKPTQEKMMEFRNQNPENWIELTSDVAWIPYSKEFREAKNRLTPLFVICSPFIPPDIH
jgi:hypothetical protein